MFSEMQSFMFLFFFALKGSAAPVIMLLLISLLIDFYVVVCFFADSGHDLQHDAVVCHQEESGDRVRAFM